MQERAKRLGLRVQIWMNGCTMRAKLMLLMFLVGFAMRRGVIRARIRATYIEQRALFAMMQFTSADWICRRPLTEERGGAKASRSTHYILIILSTSGSSL